MLRFFAFFCVFIHHVANAKNAGNSLVGGLVAAAEISLSFAVSLFFVLSAFLITTLLEMEMERTGTVHVGSFYVRRGTRIWPLYYFFLGLCSVIGLWLPAWHISLPFLAAWVLMVGNWYIIQHGTALAAVTVIWSVNIEEQFYLFCPWIVSLFRRRGMVILALVAVMGSYVTLLWLGHRQVFDDVSLRLNTMVEMQYFAVGTLLAAILRRRDIVTGNMARAALFLSGIFCWNIGTYFFDSRSVAAHLWWLSPAAEHILITAGCLAFFFSFYGLKVGKVLQPLAYLGKISYGLYLYHILFIVAVRALLPGGGGVVMKVVRAFVSLGLTIAAASASYALLEKPFLKLKDRFAYVQSRAA